MQKKFVKCLVEFDEIGNKIPKQITFNDRVFIVDKVFEVKNCASFKVGGIGERYKIRINGNITYIFFEEGKWFVEAKWWNIFKIMWNKGLYE